MSNQLLQELLDGVAEPMRAAAQAAQGAPRADDRPARRNRLDRSDRWRLISGAAALWLLGLVCTSAVFSLLTGWLIGAGLAVIAQFVLSGGELLIVTGVGILAKLAGLALLGIDSALNVVGGDTLIPGVTLTIDVQSMGFWIALAIGLAIAGLPELMWRTAHTRK